MPVQTWTSLLNFPAPSSGTALASSVALTDITPAPQFTFPANYLQVGMAIDVFAQGTFSNTATPTLLLGVYYGGVAGTKLAAIGATTTTTGATNWPWRLYYRATVRSVGSSGTIMGGGYVLLGTSLTAMTLIPIDAAAAATVTIDTTTAKTLTIGAQWGASSASNTTTCVQFHAAALA